MTNPEIIALRDERDSLRQTVQLMRAQLAHHDAVAFDAIAHAQDVRSALAALIARSGAEHIHGLVARARAFADAMQEARRSIRASQRCDL